MKLTVTDSGRESAIREGDDGPHLYLYSTDMTNDDQRALLRRLLAGHDVTWEMAE